MRLEPGSIRRQFPFLKRTGQIAYFDSASTSQKPEIVLRTLHEALAHHAGNVHRGMHPLAEEATVAYEAARSRIGRFLGAANSDEIVITRGATEAINLVARSLGEGWGEGDAVVVTELEHHSNIVPWMQLHERRGVELRWAQVGGDGRLDLDHLAARLSDGQVRLVAVTGQSNVLGILPPLREIIALARQHGALVLVDAAQLVAHAPIDVAALDCDFLVFSGHKVYGPTGVGALYGKRQLLRAMPPFLGGGMMIREVTETGFTPAEPPHRFEAGTPPIAEAIALAAAVEWLAGLGWESVRAHEQAVLSRLVAGLRDIDGLTVLGPSEGSDIGGCVSLTTDGLHPHDLTELLGRRGFHLRAGHHCAQPLHRRLGAASSTRASVGVYNTVAEAGALADVMGEVLRDWRSTQRRR